MNTKYLIAAASALTLLTGGAHAAETYAGGDLGLSHFDVDCSGAQSCNRDGTSVNVYGGYGFGNGWAVELGYISFGEATAKVGGVTPKIEASGLKLGVAYLAPLNRDWDFSARLGAVNMKTKRSESAGALTVSATDTQVTPYFGLGLDYKVSKTLKLTGGLEFSRAEFDGDVAALRALTVGARVAF